MKIQNTGNYIISLDLGVVISFNREKKEMLITRDGQKIRLTETSYTNWEEEA